MPELKNCEYVLIEYAPSPLRDTRLAIGLFLFNDAGRLVRQGFARDWRRVRCLDPQADLTLLENVPGYFEAIRTGIEASLGEQQWTGDFYRQLLRMRQECSGGIQISPAKGVRTADPQSEFDRLFQEHVEPPRAARESRPPREGSRPWIHAQLCGALQHRALWERLSKDVPVEEFTAPGDGFRIDFGYRPNGVTKFLHAISLERDWNQAKLLSYTFWRIRQKMNAQMTAIVAEGDGGSAESCREILAGAEIHIQPLSGLDDFLDGVKRDLRM